MEWGSIENLMFVIGATQEAAFSQARKISPDHFFLVPGVGAQGGSIKTISEKAMNADTGLLVNVSRAVIYSSGKPDFAEASRAKAIEFQYEMLTYIKSK